MNQQKIQIKDVYKIFGDSPLYALNLVKKGVTKSQLLEEDHTLGLNKISIDIAESEIFVVMGLSGSGKSTLIRHLNRLIEPTAGEILIDGVNILKLSKKKLLNLRRYKMSMVFQRFALLPHKTVIDNVAYGLVIGGLDKKKSQKKSL